MEQLYEYLYGVLVHPKRTFAKLAVKQPAGLAVLVFLGASLISVCAGFMDLPPEFPAALRPAVPAFIMIALLGSFLLYLVKTAVLHLTAELLGGRGCVRGLLSVLGFAYLPAIFSAPVALIGRFFSGFLAVPLSIVLYVWMFVLGVLAVREAYGISTGRAVAVVFLPAAVLVAALLLCIIVIAACAAPILHEIFGEMNGMGGMW